MRDPVENGEIILGQYEVTASLEVSAVYQWVECRDREAETDVVLQILRADLEPELIVALREHFNAFQSIPRRKIVVPDVILSASGSEHPLVLVYSDIPRQPLLAALQREPERAIALWEEAAERLNFLHNKRLVHGRVSADCFLVDGESVLLTGLGFTPLLEHGHAETLNELGDLLAPEVVQQRELTKAADVYGFARSVAEWDARYVDTDWYRTNTATDPAEREARIRKCADALSHISFEEDAQPEDEPEEEVTQPGIEPKEEPSQPRGGGIDVVFVLKVESQPPEAGVVSGAGRYDEDTEVELKADSRKGFEFEKWGGDLSGTENPTKIRMDGQKQAIAHFKPLVTPRCVLTVIAAPPEAGEVAGGGQFERGTRVAVQAMPRPGWMFRSWSGDLSSSTNPASLVVSSSKTVTAQFEKEATPESFTLDIRAEPTGAGDLLGGGDHLSGTTVTVRATPRSGWSFRRWSGDLSGTANPTRISMDAGKRIVAQFEREELVELRVACEPLEGGNVSGAGKHQKGTEVKLRARAAGLLWKFDGWEGDLSGSQNPTSVHMDGPKTVIARFSRCSVIVDTKVQPAGGGKVHGAGEYPHGQFADLRAEPAPGWVFDRWEGDLKGSLNPETVIVNEDKHVIAHFARATDLLLSLTAEPEEGGTVHGGGTYGKGQSVTIRAAPNRGWKFVRWSAVPVFMEREKELPITLDASKQIVAHFEREEGQSAPTPRTSQNFEVKTSAEPPEGGTITGAGTYSKGSTASVRAHPKRGWEFKRWDGDLAGSSNPAALTVDGNKAIVAHFEKSQPRKSRKPKESKAIPWLQMELTTSADPPKAGTVRGGGSFSQGQTVTVMAEAAKDWRFDHWTGDLTGTENPGTVSMDGPKTVTAHFVSQIPSSGRSSLPKWATET